MAHRLTATSAPRLAVVLAAAGLLAAACGGNSSKAAVSQQPAAGSTGAATVTVATHSGPFGQYLTDGSGRALYVFASDKGSTSTCYNQCAQYWPPFTDASTPGTAGGAKASLLGSTHRTDGGTEVTYAGHPLYYYKADTAPGDTRGQGVNASGGLWWLVAPDGSPITSAASSPASSSSSSGSAGGGYSY